MNVLIIEDELHAVNQLSAILKDISSDINVLEVIVSVREATDWFGFNVEPDLVFMDIQLSDGICFEIFQQRELLCPVIFTTAFDHYVINAFQANCVDYLLKPYSKKELKNALGKFKKIQARNQQIFNTAFVEMVLPAFQKNYKSRFFVKSNNQVYSIPVEEIAFFLTEDLTSLLVTTANKRYVVNFSLDQLEKLVNPTFFYRINRQFLIHHQAIENMEALGKGRIQIKLKYTNISAVLVSRIRTPEFKGWLGQ